MNLYELNGTGKRIWVFILTTIGIFCFSTMIWVFSSVFLKFRALKRRVRHPGLEYGMDTTPEGGREQREFVRRRVRFRQFWRLILAGHLVWAWESGIILSLMTAGQVPFLLSCKSITEHNCCKIGSDHSKCIQPDKDVQRHIWRDYYVIDAHEPCLYIIAHLNPSSECEVGFKCSELQMLD